VLAARCSPSVAVKLSVWIQIVRFEVPIDAFAARSCGTTPRRRLDHHQWGFVFLGNLRRREPGLLQRGILAEQRFLQRSSHKLSLQSVTLAAFTAEHSKAAVPHRATPDSFESVKVVTCAR
jgi:hypothetical protein